MKKYYFFIIAIFFIILVISCPVNYNLISYLENKESISIKDDDIIFYEYFEYNILSNGWVDGTDDYYYSYPTISSLPGGIMAKISKRCLRLENYGTTDYDMEGIYKNLGNISPSEISFYVRFDSYQPDSLQFVLSSNHNYAERVIFFNYTGSSIVFNNIYSYPVDIDQWYFVEFKNIDWNNFMYDVYVNETLGQEDIGFYYMSNYFDFIDLNNLDITVNSAAYIDNLTFYK